MSMIDDSMIFAQAELWLLIIDAAQGDDGARLLCMELLDPNKIPESYRRSPNLVLRDLYLLNAQTHATYEFRRFIDIVISWMKDVVTVGT